MDGVIKYTLSRQPAADECPVCDFEERGGLLALVQFLPPGSELDKAVYATVDYLSLNDMQRYDPVAWLHLLKKLLNASRKMNEQTTNTLTAQAKNGTLMPMDTPSAAAQEIRKILRGSDDPIIAAYMYSDNLLHLSVLKGENY